MREINLQRHKNENRKMKPRSAIAKGKRLEKFIAEEIEEMGLGKATRTPGSGSGRIKSDIFANIPFSIEAKHHAKISILDWIDQAKKDAERGNYHTEKWAVVFNDFRKGEFQDLYVTIDFWEFLKLLKKDSEPMIKKSDRELKFEIQRLVDIARRVIKKLD